MSTRDLCTWRIDLNGCPFMEITAPAYMRPVLMAREILLHGAPDHPEVTARWLLPEREDPTHATTR